MALAFNDWTPVKIAVDDDRVKATCIEEPADLVAGREAPAADDPAAHQTDVTTLTGISAAGRSAGEDAV